MCIDCVGIGTCVTVSISGTMSTLSNSRLESGDGIGKRSGSADRVSKRPCEHHFLETSQRSMFTLGNLLTRHD
jgi:hypothetical protein